MKLSPFSLAKILAVLAASAAFTPTALAAHDEHKKSADHLPAGEIVPVNAKTDAAWLAKAEAAYPLASCVVSDDKFDGGAMGKPQNYIYKVAGQPDRLVRFCCKDCVNDFKKDPAQYLNKIDAAAAAKIPGAKK